MTRQPLADVIGELASKYPGIEVSEQGYLTVPLETLVEFMRDLKENYGFNFLTNVTAVDYLEYFEMVYDVSVVGEPDMIHIKCRVDRHHPVVPSMVPIWGGAIWQEREVYDLLGITFQDHPDLRRILLDDNWEGHPLRKDYRYEGGRE
ncbi:NADH-quinone oxidoreductase subunit C [Desulforamulus putei]|uniref:NADH-quinone oxidoreductase n=1 Tax=Desulforamulus putei DSM 12395 TaxID=1121429 RepID=A0A1M5APQ9_9FIRM|nr:NADH-quinone oxidoreductase subunit C [Desulforamulus putei]SHF32165.1 NADH dehydrogenase subunit C [Desulforamulus putei DSM 12395]